MLVFFFNFLVCPSSPVFFFYMYVGSLKFIVSFLCGFFFFFCWLSAYVCFILFFFSVVLFCFTPDFGFVVDCGLRPPPQWTCISVCATFRATVGILRLAISDSLSSC